jgi:hypothetical protein
MQAEQSQGIDWFVGSNGNLFGDKGEFRYCIKRRDGGGYAIARNGHEFATAPSVADAKVLISRE